MTGVAAFLGALVGVIIGMLVLGMLVLAEEAKRSGRRLELVPKPKPDAP